MATYRTGTITVTNGSKTVTGASTLFKTAGVVSGDQLYIVDANNIPTGYLYEVDVVDSDTLITLKQNYQGATISDQSYMIMNMAGNQTVPNFAARLAPIMQSWGDITENINTTPQINGIPQAGETGKIDSGWLPDIPDATTETKGVVKVGTNLSATNGVITVATSSAAAKGVVELATDAEVIQGTDTERAVTPAGLLAGFPTRLRSNLLGTVSQTGGVPTGAVIERGSNANGEYIKFADGTMICTRTLQITVDIGGWSTTGQIFQMGNPAGHALPAAFYTAPVGSAMVRYVSTSSGGSRAWASIVSVTTTHIVPVLHAPLAGIVTYELQISAIGRWY